jgi:arylformamidase
VENGRVALNENPYNTVTFLLNKAMSRLIDLSHPLKHGQPSYPSDPELFILPHGDAASLGYNITQITMGTHQGTHLDVPFHFYDHGKTIDQMPLERFYGEAALIDLAPGGCLEAKTPITPEMLKPHDAKFRPGAKVIYRTGWDRKFGTPECFSDMPSLTLEAARWIAERRIGLLGMDTLSPSADGDKTHLTLLAEGVEIILVEGLANLEQLPERFTFLGLPLNIEGRDGSPIRAAAVIDE